MANVFGGSQKIYHIPIMLNKYYPLKTGRIKWKKKKTKLNN